MIELFPDPQLRLRAAPPIITGVVAVLIFVVKLPQADAFLALLATLGLVAAFEGLYLLVVTGRPVVVLDPPVADCPVNGSNCRLIDSSRGPMEGWQR